MVELNSNMIKNRGGIVTDDVVQGGIFGITQVTVAIEPWVGENTTISVPEITEVPHLFSASDQDTMEAWIDNKLFFDSPSPGQLRVSGNSPSETVYVIVTIFGGAVQAITPTPTPTTTITPSINASTTPTPTVTQTPFVTPTPSAGYPISSDSLLFTAVEGYLEVRAPTGSIIYWGDGTSTLCLNSSNTYSKYYHEVMLGEVVVSTDSNGIFQMWGTALKSIERWATLMPYVVYLSLNAYPLGTSVGDKRISKNLKTVPNVAPPGVTVSYGMFANCANLNCDMSEWDVSNWTGFEKMFAGCTEFNSDISGWDVSSSSRFDDMFHGASSFNQNLSPWDVSYMNYCERMFMDATSFNQDLSTWCHANPTSKGLFDYNTPAWTLPKPDWGSC